MSRSPSTSASRAGIDFVASFADVGGGHGGYNPDHEFFGYSRSI